MAGCLWLCSRKGEYLSIIKGCLWLCSRKGEYLSIPRGWLCYLSPEIIRRLQAGAQYQEIELPFTEASDIFAFG